MNKIALSAKNLTKVYQKSKGSDNSTLALNKVTLPFLSKLADKGYEKALKEDKNFLEGLNIYKGCVTHKAVADVFGHKYVSPKEALVNV